MAEQQEGKSGDGWGKVIGLTVAACVLVGGLLWLVVPKQSSDVVAEPPSPKDLVSDDVADAGQQLVRKAGAESQELLREEQRAARMERIEDRLGKPPRLSVQISNPLAGSCAPYFTESIVVRAIRGDFTDVVARVKIPEDKSVRERTLLYTDNEWTSILYSLPVNKTVHLYITGTGPDGLKDTVFKDITYECRLPEKQQPLEDLSGKAAKTAIEEKMFDEENFEFEFDSGAGSDKESAGQ